MLDKLTLTEAFRVLLWAVLIILPCAMSYAAGLGDGEGMHKPAERDALGCAILFFGSFAASITLAIAAYIAGGVHP